MQKPTNKQKWNRQIKIYHNKASCHFYLGVAKRGDCVAGHDMTTHPSLTKSGDPKKKYIALSINPNPSDKRKSYIDKKLRKNVNVHFEDTMRKRLTHKKGWKLKRKDKKMINKFDKNSWANKNPHNSI